MPACMRRTTELPMKPERLNSLVTLCGQLHGVVSWLRWKLRRRIIGYDVGMDITPCLLGSDLFQYGWESGVLDVLMGKESQSMDGIFGLNVDAHNGYAYGRTHGFVLLL